MTVVEKIEKYLLDMNLSYRDLAENTWIIEDENSQVSHIVIKYEEPVVLFRVKVMSVPEANREALFQKVLELNASDMLYGAYGFDDGSIVMINTLAAENMDFNEFQSTVESISLALIQHYEVLQGYHKEEV